MQRQNETSYTFTLILIKLLVVVVVVIVINLGIVMNLLPRFEKLSLRNLVTVRNRVEMITQPVSGRRGRDKEFIITLQNGRVHSRAGLWIFYHDLMTLYFSRTLHPALAELDRAAVSTVLKPGCPSGKKLKKINK